MGTRTFSEEIKRWRESGMKTKLCFEGCTGDERELWDLTFPPDYTDFSGMFRNCNTIDTLYLPSWDMSNAKNLSHMFYGCENLSGLYIEGWDLSNAEDISCMFGKCSKMEMLELSEVLFPKKDARWNLFRDCTDFACICMHGSDEDAVSTVLDSIYEAELQEKAFIHCDSNIEKQYNTITSCIDKAYALGKSIKEGDPPFGRLQKLLDLHDTLMHQTMYNGYKKKIVQDIASCGLEVLFKSLEDKDVLNIHMAEASEFKIHLPSFIEIIGQIEDAFTELSPYVQQMRQKINDYEEGFCIRCKNLYDDAIKRFDSPECTPIMIEGCESVKYKNHGKAVNGELVDCGYSLDENGRPVIRNCYVNLWGFETPYPILAFKCDAPVDSCKYMLFWDMDPYSNSDLEERYKGWTFFKTTRDRSFHWSAEFENISRKAKSVELAHLTDEGILHRIYYANFKSK